MSGHLVLTFHNLLDQLDADEHAPGVIELLEPEHRLNPKLDAAVVLFNGLITNDKFCLSLVSSQKLDWVRGPRAGVGGRSGPATPKV